MDEICSECFATVRADRQDAHGRWHNELDARLAAAIAEGVERWHDGQMLDAARRELGV